MAKKISWPEFCRAQSSATAYRTALDWVSRLPAAEVARRLQEKVKEKDDVAHAYLEQQKVVKWGKANDEYAEQAKLTDELEGK